MKNSIKLLIASFGLLCFGIAQADTLSFDEHATGLAEAVPTNSASTCAPVDANDYCDDLEFGDVTITAGTSSNSHPNDLIPWYDIWPAHWGGIGAAAEDELGNGSNDNAVIGVEYIYVTFADDTPLLGVYLNGPHVSGADGGLTAWIVDLATPNVSYAMGLVSGNSYFDFSWANLVGTQFAIWATSQVVEEYYLAGLVYGVPEPGTLALLGLGLLGIGAARRRKIP